jgi:hypothetical protein
MRSLRVSVSFIIVRVPDRSLSGKDIGKRRIFSQSAVSFLSAVIYITPLSVRAAI